MPASRTPADPCLAGYTTSDLARRWRCSPSRVRSLIARGLLSAVALPGPRPRIVVTPEQLAAAERAMTAGPPPKPAPRRRRTARVDYYPE